jgi:hypothetical protein
MTAKTKTPTHTTETLDTPAPNGDTAVKITCLCGAHRDGTNTAIVRKTYADEHNLAAATKQSYTEVHNLTAMANGPLRHAPQIKANGPWAA